MSKRLIFFLSHLLLSIFISLIVGMVFFAWYPTPLANAAGVTQIFMMMIAINVIVGPLLGLFVYKEQKKTLKFDLYIIVLIQISALCFGVFSIEQGRPVWVVYNIDRFELVRKNEIIDDRIDEALPQYQQLSWFKPQYVAIQFAKDPKQRNEDMFTEVFGGVSIAQRPERYVPLIRATAQMQQRALSLNLLEQFNVNTQVKKILAKYPQANAYLPLKANAVDMTVLINKDTAEIVKIVDLRPWK
jgi:hypothetical protein